jgi:predicted DNA-binding transcriptional regulator AlpA
MSKRYLRRKDVAHRYGEISIRTVERMVADGRLPAPEYRGRTPFWDESALDESDRAAALLPRPKPKRNVTGSTGSVPINQET